MCGNHGFMTPQEIGNFIKNKREEAGLRQADLAGKAGVSERTVMRIENGHPASDRTVNLILKLFGYRLKKGIEEIED